MLVDNDSFRFLLQLQLRGAHEQLRVIQAGPRRLWDSVEAAHQLWQHLGQPDPDRFGIVANPTTQFVWFNNDDGWYRWPLPLL